MELTCDQVKKLLIGAEDGHLFSSGIVKELCIALLAELDSPKVWDNAPEWATKATVNWSAPTHYSGVYKEYTRTLPKTRIDEIAEEAASKWAGGKKALEDAIKSTILQIRKEWEANR